MRFKIEPDKWKHFVVGIAMGMVLQAFFLYLVPAHPLLTVLLTFLFVVAISYGFELTSKITGRGHYDLFDAIASTIGGLIGMALVILFNKHLFYTLYM